MAHAHMESSGDASRAMRPQRGQVLERSDRGVSGVGPTGAITPSRRLLSLALLVAVVLVSLAPPMLAQPATVPLLPTAEDLGPGWVELPWTLPTGGPDYPEQWRWYAGPEGARVVLQVIVPPYRIFDGIWNTTATAVETNQTEPGILPSHRPANTPILPNSLPANTPPLKGCDEVCRVQGFSVEFPVLPEAVTACRASDAILVADLSGEWQGQEGVAGLRCPHPAPA